VHFFARETREIGFALREKHPESVSRCLACFAVNLCKRIVFAFFAFFRGLNFGWLPVRFSTQTGGYAALGPLW
jgi:hypothetical protein